MTRELHVTDEHIVTLHAILSGDEDEYRRFHRQFGPHDDACLSALATMALLEAAWSRFGDGASPSDVIRFVASTRACFMEASSDADELDRATCESLLFALLGQESTVVSQLDPRAASYAQMALLFQLIDEEQLTDAEIGDLLDHAAARVANTEVG